MYSEPCKTSKIQPFAKIVNKFEPLTIFPKTFILFDRVVNMLLVPLQEFTGIVTLDKVLKT